MCGKRVALHQVAPTRVFDITRGDRRAAKSCVVLSKPLVGAIVLTSSSFPLFVVTAAFPILVQFLELFTLCQTVCMFLRQMLLRV